MRPLDFIISVAPMMDWTDRHCRWFHRRLSKRVRLYTEMVVSDALIHGDRDRLAGFDESEHPVALQIGGSDPAKLTQAAIIGQDFGYDEININIGCPSDRVQSGRFGACLMAEPELVAHCYAAMAEAVNVPVTVKCRLGIDDQNLDETLPKFIETVSAAGCKTFIIHARKAWLEGLSPKDNRSVPPLDYTRVLDMKSRYSNLLIALNGGLKSVPHGLASSEGLDGIMFGRVAYHEPWMLTDVDGVYGDKSFAMTREDVIDDVIGYVTDRQSHDPTTKAIIRHLMGIYHGQPGARIWRRSLSEGLSAGLPPSENLRTALIARQNVLGLAA